MAAAFVTGSTTSTSWTKPSSSTSAFCTKPSKLISAASRSTTTTNASAIHMSRTFFVGGNWKCNGSKKMIKDLVDAINADPAAHADASKVEVIVAPPASYLDYTKSILRPDWQVSGQNCWIKEGGAYTGEVSADMLTDVGCKWVILGHSERRHLPQLKESDDTIATKTMYAISKGLGVIYCIGELLEEREAGKTIEVCERQMKALASKNPDWTKIVVAYEPVWAIGTGKVASPEQAEEVHASLRTWMASHVSKAVSDSVRILYGGSVSPGNCDELAKKPNIDGFLVGGASLKPDFVKIVESYKSKA